MCFFICFVPAIIISLPAFASKLDYNFLFAPAKLIACSLSIGTTENIIFSVIGTYALVKWLFLIKNLLIFVLLYPHVCPTIFHPWADASFPLSLPFFLSHRQDTLVNEFYLSPSTKNKVHASGRQDNTILQGVLIKKHEHTTSCLLICPQIRKMRACLASQIIFVFYTFSLANSWPALVQFLEWQPCHSSVEVYGLYEINYTIEL